MLAQEDSQYDSRKHMIRTPLSSPGYHTTLTTGWVHPTCGSLWYALALLDSNKPNRLRRATLILSQVLPMQDVDPQSPTFGIWPWFLEEPLQQMSPPDWNWAEFCGTPLVQITMSHRDRLPAPLAGQLDQSLLSAAEAIRRRNVGPHYTNIALMGTYVSYAVARFYHAADLLEYARGRLLGFWDYTQKQGAFAEFNSPAYSVVSIRVLARMHRDIDEVGISSLIDQLYDLAWMDVARHFHPPTNQWAGPHSRSAL